MAGASPLDPQAVRKRPDVDGVVSSVSEASLNAAQSRDYEVLVPGPWVTIWHSQFMWWLKPLLALEARRPKLVDAYLVVEEALATMDNLQDPRTGSFLNIEADIARIPALQDAAARLDDTHDLHLILVLSNIHGFGHLLLSQLPRPVCDNQDFYKVAATICKALDQASELIRSDLPFFEECSGMNTIGTAPIEEDRPVHPVGIAPRKEIRPVQPKPRARGAGLRYRKLIAVQSDPTDEPAQGTSATTPAQQIERGRLSKVNAQPLANRDSKTQVQTKLEGVFAGPAASMTAPQMIGGELNPGEPRTQEAAQQFRIVKKSDSGGEEDRKDNRNEKVIEDSEDDMTYRKRTQHRVIQDSGDDWDERVVEDSEDDMAYQKRTRARRRVIQDSEDDCD